MTTILIKTSQRSPRLIFVLDWLFTNRLKTAYKLVNTLPTGNTNPVIVYGQAGQDFFCIPDAGLLWEQTIGTPQVATGKWEQVPVLFAVKDSVTSLPFDLFSAVFYLLSRYEEYLPHAKDKYQRYPATESILYRLGCLETPVIDVWVQAFKKLLSRQFDIRFVPDEFKYIPTYDIDIAWCYRHKGLKRSVGALVKNTLRSEFADIGERIGVLTGLKPDPYDCFTFLESCHAPHGLSPIFFILSSLKTTTFDKNISPRHPAMKHLVTRLAEKDAVGIHPSYYSQQNGELQKELQILEKVTHNKITQSRQHYLHMQLPGTYRLLLSLGITTDYTMGYGTHLGFRAGTSHSFPWYDLQLEQTTSLTLFPFCFMDTTAHFNQQLSASDAFEKLEIMTKKLHELGGVLITIFHNFSIGTDRRWKNWHKNYAEFIAEQGQYIESQHGKNKPM